MCCVVLCFWGGGGGEVLVVGWACVRETYLRNIHEEYPHLYLSHTPALLSFALSFVVFRVLRFSTRGRLRGLIWKVCFFILIDIDS